MDNNSLRTNSQLGTPGAAPRPIPPAPTPLFADVTRTPGAAVVPNTAPMTAQPARPLPTATFTPLPAALPPNPKATPLTPESRPMPKSSRSWRKTLVRSSVVALILLLVGAGTLLFNTLQNRPATTQTNSELTSTSIPLSEFADSGSLSLLGSQSLIVNGQLRANESFVLAPQTQPQTGERGQIYYDSTSNQLAYYNGTQFVTLPGDNFVQSFQGQSGNVTLTAGNGITIAGTTFTNSGVTSFAGQTGDITVGSGLAMDGSELQATGVQTLSSGSVTLTVTDDGAGNLTITSSGGGTGTVTSAGGTAGTIPMFTSSQNIENSILTQSGGTITVGGSLSVTGGITLATPLSVANGGTGASGLSSNGVIIGNGTSPLTSVTAGGAGLCLMSTGGAPAFSACPGSGGVTTLNGLAGVLTIANASGAGSTITIDDASTTVKGIAQFNATNFSAAGGLINTIQNINTGASPTFTNMTLSGDIGVNGGDITSSGALNITPGGTLIVGATAQTLSLQGNASSTLSATSGGNTTALTFQTPTANVNYRLPTAAAGTYDVCSTAGNCAGVGGGVTTAGGTTNRLAKFTAAQGIGDSTISDDGATVSTTVDLVIQGGDVTVGVASSQTGTVRFADSGSTFFGSIVQGTLGSTDRTYTLPDASGTFCLTSGNCSGSGSSNTLQASYDAGNSITTTNNRDLDIVLANTTVDSNFDIVVADGSTSTVSISRANGAGTADPSQMILIDNLDTDRAVAAGIKLQAAAGGITTAIDASDAEIGDALNAGANNIVGTTGNLDFSNFDVVGSTGSITTAGNLALNGGNLTSTSALNITPGGTLTVGDAAQALIMQGNASTTLSAASGANVNTLAFAAPSGGTKTITIGNEAGTLCIQNSTACGFAASSGSANYIQNQIGSDQTADFRISGTGRANTSLLTPLLDTASASILAIGTTNATAINLNQSTTLGTNKNLTFSGGNINTISGTSGTALTIKPGDTTGSNGTGAGLNLYGGDETSGTCGTSCTGGSVIIQGGTATSVTGTRVGGNVTIDAGSANNTNGTVSIGTTSGLINIGSTSLAGLVRLQGANGGIIRIGDNGTTASVQIGNTTGAVSQAINIGNNSIGGSTSTVNIGSTVGTSSTMIRGGSGGITLNAGGTTALHATATTVAINGGTTINGNFNSSANINTGTSNGTITLGGGSAPLVIDSTAFDVTVAGAVSGVTSLSASGIITQGTLGAANTATYLCRNATNEIANCQTNAIGTAFVQGGNSFTGLATLGTNDAFDLAIERGGTTQLTVGSGTVTLASDVDLLLQGSNAFISNPQGQTASQAFGLNAVVTGANSLAVGHGASTSASGDSTAVGTNAISGINGTALGYAANAQGHAIAIGGSSYSDSGGLALGANSNAAFVDSIAMGYCATTTAVNQMVIGSGSSCGSSYINKLIIGNGVTEGAPVGFTLQGTSGNGSNIAGASIAIAGGQGTGTGNGGSINLQIADPGSSGSSLNALATVMSLSGTNGSATMQNTTDSADAFRILSSNSSELVGVDSTSSFVRLLGNNTAHLTGTGPGTGAGQWSPGATLPSPRGSGATVIVNGYLYSVAGGDSGGGTNDVYFTKLNSDGSMSGWTQTTDYPYNVFGQTVTTYNGYIYGHGGTGTAATGQDIVYAKPNADGTISAWTIQDNPTNLVNHSNGGMAAYNGYIYITGGSDASTRRNVYYGRINGDGSVPTFSIKTNWLPASTEFDPGQMVIANGYMYVMGSASYNQFFYGRILAAGDPGTPAGATGVATQTTQSALVSRKYASLAVMNGYLYVIAGDVAGLTTVEYAPFSSSGNITTAFQTDTTVLPAARTVCPSTAPTYNGYMYLVACGEGNSFNPTDTTYYASGSRVKVGSALDLVGYSGEGASEGQTGGQLTAGNTSINGLLSVTGNAVFKDGASVNSALSVQAYADTTGLFGVTNAAGVTQFSIDSTNSRTYIGNPTSDPTGALLVLDTKSGSGDPSTTGLTGGAMYYNAASGSMRCFQVSTWVNCVGGLVAVNTSIPGGNTIASTAAETNFASNWAMPASYCVAGRTIRWTAQGTYGTTGTPGLTLRLKAGSTTLAATPNVTTGSGVSGREWRIEGQTICNAAPGATAATETQGMASIFTAATTAVDAEMVNTATTNLATNGALTLQISAQWDASSASNTITMRQFVVEAIGPN